MRRRHAFQLSDGELRRAGVLDKIRLRQICRGETRFYQFQSDSSMIISVNFCPFCLWKISVEFTRPDLVIDQLQVRGVRLIRSIRIRICESYNWVGMI